MIVFTKARKGKMVMPNSVRYAVWLKVGNITKINPKYVLQSMKDGLKEIQIKFLRIKELITKEIKKKYWKSLKKQERKMDIETPKLIVREIWKRSNATTMWLLRLNLDILLSRIFVKNVKTIVRHKLITMIIPNHWTLFGYAEHVMEKSIEYIYQRERLNLWTPKGDAIVQTTEETCRGKFEAISPPRNRSVSKLLLKVIEWLRHTAGASFYQGQCITNDLWIQNLRSTGI